MEGTVVKLFSWEEVGIQGLRCRKCAVVPNHKGASKGRILAYRAGETHADLRGESFLLVYALWLEMASGVEYPSPYHWKTVRRSEENGTLKTVDNWALLLNVHVIQRTSITKGVL